MADELPITEPAPHTRPAGHAGPAQPAAPEGDARVVTRSVEVDAHPDAVWQAVTDPAERALWLDDPDALARHVRVDESAPGRRLVWTWWHPGDEGDATTVSVVLSPGDGGGTRVVVTESLPGPVAPTLLGTTGPTASARSARSATPVGRRSPSWVRCARDRWDSRLLGLELLFVAARAHVA